MTTPLLFTGTSGMVFAAPNKAAFPPAFRDKPRLSYYASLFNSLEVNSTFYKVPKAATIARWVTEVPDDFRFTIKLWKGITHSKDKTPQAADMLHFMQVIAAAGHKKGCLLIQFPASYTAVYAAQLYTILQTITAANKPANWRLALEFRHNSWYTPATYQLADDYNAAIVLHDMPNSLFQEISTRAPFVYLRFHGPAGDYKGGYEDAQLQHYASLARQWMQDGKEVYVYFNNTIGDALQNVQTLRSMIVAPSRL